MEECSNVWRMIVFRYFSCLGSFFQVFEQVKKWLILELYEMIRLSHAVAWWFILIFLSDLGEHGGVLSFFKKGSASKYFQPLWSVSTIFWVGRGAGYTVFDKNCQNMLYSCVLNAFCFALQSSLRGRSLKTYNKCWNLSISSRLGPFLHFLGRSRSSWY